MKCITLLLTATALALVPAAARAAPAAEAAKTNRLNFEQFTLPNGLRVIVHEDHAVPKVAVSVWYHVGSMNEPQGKSGFAHLFEHLMFNGSANHDKEYFPPLQEIGASDVNGATSLDQTFYYEVVPTGGLERVLWLESDRMGHLLGAVTQAKLDEQRKVVQNEKRTRENQPYAMMQPRKMAGLFPAGHPYHHPIIGSMEDLDDATLEDVKDWFTEHYGAANAVIAITGDVTAQQARELVTRYFGSIPAGRPTGRSTAWVPTLNQDKTEVMRDNVPQAALSWSWAVPGRNSETEAALKMAAFVLGRGRSSRLYQALVQERQLATQVHAGLESHALAGIFSIDVTLKEGADRALAEKVIADVLRDFQAKGPTADEMARARISSYGDTVRALESIYVRAMALSDGAIFANDPGNHAEQERRFEAVTAPQVVAASRDWLGEGGYRLTVLPFGTHQVAADGADRRVLPPLAPSPGLSLPAIEQARLANGIEVQFARRPGTPVVELMMTFDAGSAAEQRVKRGLAGFTLGLMDKGTRSLSGLALAERQAALGARIHAFGDADTTSVALSALTRTLPESIALWADQIRNPAFRPEDLERDRALSLSGLSQSLADPNSIAQRTFSHLLYGDDHAYGVHLANRGETIRSFTRDDVLAFHESWLRPDNAVIYAAGDTDLATLVAALDQAFGDWRAPSRPRGEKMVAPLPPGGTKRVILVDKPGAIQSVIRVGHMMESGTDPAAFDHQSANALLGGHFTSRLNMNLREDKGWTYGASSFIADARGPQTFGVATSVQTDKTAEALREIDQEVRGLRDTRPATPQELDLMRKGQVLALPGQLETNRALVSYLHHNDRFDRPYDYLAGLPDRYAALRPETITATARKMIRPDSLTWVVVGDLAKVEQGVRSLGLGPVEVWDAEGRRIR